MYPEPPPSNLPPPGWYPDPEAIGQRWWDGQNWGQRAPSAPTGAPGYYGPVVALPPAEKSSGIALLLTIIWPGAGHMYLGLTQKSVPFVVANAVGFVLAFTLILAPITVLIWIVTLAMTVGSVSADTEFVNFARQQGRRVA